MTTESDRRLDADLLTRSGRGDAAAFAQLYDRFSPALYSLVLRMVREETEAEDVLQEGFSHIWQRAATYDSQRSSAFTWAVMVFRHKAIDRLRLHQRPERNLGEMAQPRHFAETDDASAGEPAMRELRMRVRSALAHISDEQKQALELAVFSELRHEEIAERLGAPLGTVKTRIRRGLLRLREALRHVS
jgi:RNA polymerase sigma-70 factor (ECF subfamily)